MLDHEEFMLIGSLINRELAKIKDTPAMFDVSYNFFHHFLSELLSKIENRNGFASKKEIFVTEYNLKKSENERVHKTQRLKNFVFHCQYTDNNFLTFYLIRL